MTLNGVISSFATGTYVVTRRADGTYVDMAYVLPSLDDEVEVSSVDHATDVLTSVGHGMITGAGPFRLVHEGFAAAVVGEALPSGLSIETKYWAIRVDDDTFMLALSEADAIAEVAVDVTDAGVGEFTLATRRFQVEMCVQPARGKDLVDVPEANRTGNMKLAFCGELLITREDSTEPDVVGIANKATGVVEDWTVVTSEDWDHWGETHWRFWLSRDEET